MSQITSEPSPADRAVCIALEHLRGIVEQADDLQALLCGLDVLPPSLASDVLRVLCRLDNDMAGLVERVGASGPGE